MVYRLLPDDLANRLKAVGLRVVEIDGWRSRGRPSSTGEFKPVGVLNHHTGARDVIGDFADDLSYAKWMALTGRGTSLPPPLCQLSISLEGMVFLLAAGRANHAGVAKPSGSVAGGDGNALYVGIEWMLSGTQAIPADMYEAGVKTNAVLLDLFKTSVQTISCHYQTSVTGKWDIGDPSGIVFRGHKVFDVPKFRNAVKAYRDSDSGKTQSDANHIKIDMMHASLQFSDTDQQHKQDITDLFKRARNRRIWTITGTEAGPGSGNTGRLLKQIGNDHGYRVHVPSEGDGKGASTDCWVAVSRERIDGAWKQNYKTSIPGSKALYKKAGFSDEKAGSMKPKWGPRGLVRVSFFNEDIGSRINVGAAHYLTKNDKTINKVDHGEWNEILAGDIGEWARKTGKGMDIVIYGGDQNLNDKKRDTFFGSPLTSLQDELKKWPGTGPGGGPIDVLATYDNDDAVVAKYIRALDDKEFPQHHDHFVLEGGITVRRKAG